jgi:hypothetical protein
VSRKESDVSVLHTYIPRGYFAVLFPSLSRPIHVRGSGEREEGGRGEKTFMGQEKGRKTSR